MTDAYLFISYRGRKGCVARSGFHLPKKRKAAVMCGRFALAPTPKSLFEHFGVEAPLAPARYNIAPTRYVPLLLREPEAKGRIGCGELFWGLTPFWAKDKKMAARLINARAETVDTKPAFRAAFRHRRCLVPASGFYEWRREGGEKTPFYFTASAPKEGLVFAGVWEEWVGGGEILRSFAILTTAANDDMRPVHDRMPVLVSRDGWERWLDPTVQRRDELEALLAPRPSGALVARRVGTYVNSPAHEGPRCVEPA